LGLAAGSDVTTANNVICIGSTVGGANISNSCFIGNVFDGHVGSDAFLVGVNADNKVGDTFAAASPSKLRIKDVVKAFRKIDELEATVAALSTQLKEQAAQIQKVSTQVDLSRPTTKVILNNP
jgi:phosphoheptose isomerase